MLRSRTRLVRKLREPHRGRHVQRLDGLLAHDAVDDEAMPRLEAADAGLDVGIVDVGAAGIGVEIAGDRSGAGAAPTPPDGGCRAAAGRLWRPPASRPWRRCPRIARSPARCAARSPATASAATPSASGWCASRNRSPGRNRCPGSGRSAPRARHPGRTRARREAAAGERGRQQAAQDGAPARMAWSGELVIAVPEPRSPEPAGSALAEADGAALGKSRIPSAQRGKAGAGRICDECARIGPNAPNPRGRNARGPGRGGRCG